MIIPWQPDRQRLLRRRQNVKRFYKKHIPNVKIGNSKIIILKIFVNFGSNFFVIITFHNLVNLNITTFEIHIILRVFWYFREIWSCKIITDTSFTLLLTAFFHTRLCNCVMQEGPPSPGRLGLALSVMQTERLIRKCEHKKLCIVEENIFEEKQIWYMNGYNINHKDGVLKIWDTLIDNGFVYTFVSYVNGVNKKKLTFTTITKLHTYIDILYYLSTDKLLNFYKHTGWPRSYRKSVP